MPSGGSTKIVSTDGKAAALTADRHGHENAGGTACFTAASCGGVRIA